ncbi:unnamed protein product, partial [Vitis vinifera]|uniref:Uncharacterized protein n=1 Tax=Vitis vinifera TaxID=29760 RepID=D7TSI4_VITVI
MTIFQLRYNTHHPSLASLPNQGLNWEYLTASKMRHVNIKCRFKKVLIMQKPLEQKKKKKKKPIFI